jgi:hypothetical protein
VNQILRSLLDAGCAAKRWIAPGAVAALVTVYSCSSDDGGVDPGPPPPTPVINSISKSVLAPGDTLEIEGENFSEDTSKNRVIFNNKLASATPYFATAGSLAVEVPLWATSGPLRVTSLGVSSAPVTVDVLRGVGDVWVVGGTIDYQFKLPAPIGNEEYVLIPYSASTAAIIDYTYSVSPESAAVYPSPPALTAAPVGGTVNLPLEFELSVREQAIEHMRDHSGGVGPIARVQAASVPPDTTTFRVLRCASCSTSLPSNYKTITAALVYNDPN